MGNLVFGSGAEPGRASKARGGLTESPMERYYDATESDGERYKLTRCELTYSASFLFYVPYGKLNLLSVSYLAHIAKHFLFCRIVTLSELRNPSKIHTFLN